MCIPDDGSIPRLQNSTTKAVKDYRSIKESLTMVFAIQPIGFIAILREGLRSL